MSFRHTYITEFLYKAEREDELNAIEKALEEYGTVNWHGDRQRGYGYFHGVIKDLNGHDVQNEEEAIVEALQKIGVRIKIVLE